MFPKMQSTLSAILTKYEDDDIAEINNNIPYSALLCSGTFVGS